jgi:very-short-patch-repair endonuclease
MQKTPGLNKLESFFKMTFKQVIDELHWRDGKSVKWISDQCGISRDTIQRQAKNHGLKLRDLPSAAMLTPNKGNKHWAYGLNKENSDWAKMHSDRMKADNAMLKSGAAEKRAKTISLTLKKRDLPQEAAFSKILSEYGVLFEEQRPFGAYNADFFIQKNNCIIEIDSTSKWTIEKKMNAKKRDRYIFKKFGVKTIRINKSKLLDRSFINDILKAHNIIGQC